MEKLIVMVSSTVYGIEALLERIYAILTRFGYEVRMSHKGTMPVVSIKSMLLLILTNNEHTTGIRPPMRTSRLSPAKDQQMIVVCDSAAITAGDISGVLNGETMPQFMRQALPFNSRYKKKSHHG